MKQNFNFLCSTSWIGVLLGLSTLLSPCYLSAQKQWHYGFLDENKPLPLKGSRTVSFSTDEGSFMDIDVSKDGKTLLFNLLGDLYTMSVEGGKAKQLTQGMEMISRPLWSPDGKKFACLSDANGGLCLQVRLPDGKVLRQINLLMEDRLPDRQFFRWLPDNKTIFVPRIGAVSVEAGSITRFPSPIDQFSGVIAVNDKSYYFFLPGYSESKIRKVGEGIRPDSLGGNVRFKSNMAGFIKISSDEKWAVYPDFCKSDIKGAPKATFTRLMALDLKTGIENVLVDTLNKNTLRIFDEGYCFAPDNRSVFIGYGGKIHKIDVYSGENITVPFKAEIKSSLGALVHFSDKLAFHDFKVKYIKNVRKSPLGNQLAFEALGSVYVMDLPDGRPRILTRTGDIQMNPVYTPDGKWIVFVSRNDNGGGFVWKASSDGAQVVKLIEKSGNYLNPNLSAAGDKLVVCIYQDDSQKLVFYDMNSGRTSVKPDSLGYWIRPSVIPQFSVDGNHIYFGSNDEKDRLFLNYTVLSKSGLEVNDRQRAGFNPVIKWWPQYIEQVVLSPDNRFVVFSRFNSLYIKRFHGDQLPDTLMDDHKWNETFRFAKNGLNPWWSNDGKKISYSVGDKFYEVSLDRLVASIVKQADPKISGAITNDLNVEPDSEVAIDLSVPSAYGHGSVVLKNARIIPMEGNSVMENASILITDGRIVSVKGAGELRIPENAKEIDCSGKTIMPGLIDVHDHLHLEEGITSKQSWRLMVNLAYGVTTAVDPSAEDNEFGYGEMVNAGISLGPRIFTASRPINDGFIIRSLDDASILVRYRSAYGGRLIKEYDQELRTGRQWTLMAAKKYRLHMTNESSQSDVYRALAQFKDGSSGVEHQYNWWHEAYDDVKTLVAKSGTWLTPTLSATRAMYDGGAWGGDWFLLNHYKKNPDARFESFFPASDLEWKRLPLIDSLKPDFINIVKRDVEMVNKGLFMPIGGHGDFPAMGMHLELYGMHLGGMDNMTILKSATLNGARTLGLEKDLGSIKAGKIADLIILDKNPLVDIENTRSISYLMKSGILYDGKLNSIWPIVKNAPEIISGKNK